jgi:transglutaminase/protease-like cytokinesis protein 3
VLFGIRIDEYHAAIETHNIPGKLYRAHLPEQRTTIDRQCGIHTTFSKATMNIASSLRTIATAGILLTSSVCFMTNEVVANGNLDRNFKENYTAKKPNSFVSIDAYAESVPHHIATQPLTKLVAYLTKPATNDFEKARAIARWITSNIAYDFEAATANDGKRRLAAIENVESILHTRSATDVGFATLFVKMLLTAGVEAFPVAGLQKGVNFAPGDATTLKRHMWNAFRTGGKWYLVDLPVYKEVETDGSYKLTYADSFFCISPEQMSYTNFPDDKGWQLFEKPITKEQFVSSVQCFGAFYGYAVTAVSHREYAISTKEHVLSITVDAPSGLQLGARVYADQNANNQNANNQKAVIKTTRDGRKCTVTVRFPADGMYNVELTATEFIKQFAKDRASSSIIGCSVKTVAEYSVQVGERVQKSMAAQMSTKR